MVDLPDLRAGVYQHYKGPFYQVLGYAHDANTTEDFYKDADGHSDGMRMVVVYFGLQLDDAHTGPRLAVRSVDDFFKPVCWNSLCERYGTSGERPEFGVCSLCTASHRPRFDYRTPQWVGA